MKITKTAMTALAAAAIGAIGMGSAPTASANFTADKFGAPERLYDAGGSVVTAWTIRDRDPVATPCPTSR